MNETGITQIQGVLENIASQKRNTRYGEKFVYELILRDDKRKISSWDRQLAEQAWSRKDQLSIFEVEVSTNTTERGTFTNYTLKGVYAPTESMQTLGNIIPQVAPVQFQPQTSGSSGTFTMTTSMPSDAAMQSSADAREAAKNKSIHRQCATKVAAVLSKTETDFWANVDSLIHFYETGERPGSQRYEPTPEPAFDAPIPDDDIPF